MDSTAETCQSPSLTGGTPTLGTLFRRARRSFGLSIDEISEDIKIRSEILNAIEQGAFERIEEPVYRTLMVKTYAEYLGISWETVEAGYIRESVYTPSNERANGVGIKPVQNSDLMVVPRLLKHVLLSAAMIGVFFYFMVLAGSALQRPALTITNPPERFMSAAKTIRIEGSVSPDASLAINGQEVTKTNDGHFNQDLSLSDGLNTIRISASKKYSKETVVTRTVLYQAPSLPLSFNEQEYGKATTR